MLKGVLVVLPGYSGGNPPAGGENPTYAQVSNGTTGHAEAVYIEFDPNEVSYRTLLTVFFGSHDSTTRNRQGSDIGTQYRSVIFYTTPEQKKEAEAFIKEINDSNKSGGKVVTDIEPLDKFYEAENYHKDYFAKNPGNSYCQIVINPKLDKVREHFAELLRGSM